MSRVRGIAQWMHGLTIDRLILLFLIASLNHKGYPGVKSRYLVGDSALVNCDLRQLSGILSSEETKQRALGIPAISPSTTSANRVSNTKNNPHNERPVPQRHQSTTQSSNVTYPPTRGLPCKYIAAMMQEDKSCLGFHFNHPDHSPKLKFHQEVRCPALAKHGYIYWKDVTSLAEIVDRFNTKFPRMTDQAQVNKPVAKRISDDFSSNHISSIHVHSPSISNTTIDSTVPPAHISNTVLLMPNRAAPTPTSNGYNNLYSSDSDDNPVFEEMVDSNSINPINTYIVVPPNLTLVITPHKVLKKGLILEAGKDS